MSRIPIHHRMDSQCAVCGALRPEPIVISITNAPERYCYRVDGPVNLAHKSSGPFEVAGDRSLCEATIKALRTLTPRRTWWPRTALRTARAANCGCHPGSSSKLPIVIETTSPTFAQIGEYLSTNPRVATKGGRLVPSMRQLHRQLQRFCVQWKLTRNPKRGDELLRQV